MTGQQIQSMFCEELWTSAQWSHVVIRAYSYFFRL